MEQVAVETPTGGTTVVTSNGNGNGKVRAELIRGLLFMLFTVIVGLVVIVLYAPLTEWQITKDVVTGMLTLATVLSSGLVGMAKGTAS